MELHLKQLRPNTVNWNSGQIPNLNLNWLQLIEKHCCLCVDFFEMTQFNDVAIFPLMSHYKTTLFRIQITSHPNIFEQIAFDCFDFSMNVVLLMFGHLLCGDSVTSREEHFN